MDRTTNVIDFARYRTRRQARRMAELMWMMYACRAGQETQLIAQARDNGGIREA
ncbi:hypothetical protein [Pseudomonas sp. LRF_L74]|uniref:hypothetical protein n=1 Tax=Pseudomonas sp. LRF_L74 TaxID=3369422 RepID=UPI003F603E3A